MIPSDYGAREGAGQGLLPFARGSAIPAVRIPDTQNPLAIAWANYRLRQYGYTLKRGENPVEVWHRLSAALSHPAAQFAIPDTTSMATSSASPMAQQLAHRLLSESPASQYAIPPQYQQQPTPTSFQGATADPRAMIASLLRPRGVM